MKQLSSPLVFYFAEEPTAVYLASLEILSHFLQPNCTICVLLSSVVQSRIVLFLRSTQSKKSYKNIPQSKSLQIKPRLGQWQSFKITHITHHTWLDFSGQLTSPMQRPLPDNTQHSQQTNDCAPAVFEPTIPASEQPQTHTAWPNGMLKGDRQCARLHVTLWDPNCLSQENTTDRHRTTQH